MILNELETTYWLQAFHLKGQHNPPDPIELKPKDVKVLPLTWFEKDYQMQITKTPILGIERQKEEHYLLKNGTMHFVLNPDITDPYKQHDKTIHLDDEWISFGLALL